MLVKNEGQLISLEGILNEHVDLQVVESAIIEASKTAADGSVSLDLSKVSRANSSGLLQWLRMTKRLKNPLKYVRTPVWLVEQFNMIDEFFDGQISVESVYAHFYCPDTDTSETHLLNLGVEVPVQDQYKTFRLKIASSDGKELEPDFDERSYFHFIARHLAKPATGN
jgi:ABC-type transporter Mla MlaB component